MGSKAELEHHSEAPWQRKRIFRQSTWSYRTKKPSWKALLAYTVEVGDSRRWQKARMSFAGALNHSLELFTFCHKLFKQPSIITSGLNKVCTFPLCVTWTGVLGPETSNVNSKQLHPSSNCRLGCPPAVLTNAPFLVAQWHTSSSRNKGPVMMNGFQPWGKSNHVQHEWGKSNIPG